MNHRILGADHGRLGPQLWRFPKGMGGTVLQQNAQAHMDVIGHTVPFKQVHTSMAGQLS